MGSETKVEDPTETKVNNVLVNENPETEIATNKTPSSEGPIAETEGNTNASINKKDTLSNYNSSCKFNILFYFIYKVKYDENGDIDGGSLNFEF